jgi:hypothetical protein
MVHTIILAIGCIVLSVIMWKDIKFLANHLWQ